MSRCTRGFFLLVAASAALTATAAITTAARSFEDSARMVST
jgi:hypothetical protein